MALRENLGEGVLQLTTDRTQFSKGLDKAAKQAQDFGKRITKIGRTFTLGFTAPLAAAGGAAVKFAADVQESVNAVEVVFGDAADAVLSFSETAINRLGMTQTAVNQAATVIGSQLQNVGISAGEAAEWTQTLMTRAADMASVFNTTVDQALTAIQAGLRGEADPLERFGVGLNMARVEAYALANGIAESTAEMSLQEKTLARLNLLLVDTERVAGDMQNTWFSVANTMKRVRTRLQEVAADFGEVLLPIAEKVLIAIDSFLESLGELSTEGRRRILLLFGAFAAIGPALLMIGGLITALGKLVIAFNTVGRVVARVFTLMLSNPWVLLGVAIATVTALIIANWEQVKKSTEKLAYFIRDIFTELGENLNITGEAIGKIVGGAIRAPFLQFGEFMQDFGQKFGESMERIFTFGLSGRPLKEIWKGQISDAFEGGIRDPILDEGLELLDQAGEQWEAHGEKWKNVFEGVGGAVTDVVVDLSDRVKGLLGGAETTWEGVKGVFGELQDVVDETKNKIDEATKAIENMGKETQRTMNTIAEGARQIPMSVIPEEWFRQGPEPVGRGGYMFRDEDVAGTGTRLRGAGEMWGGFQGPQGRDVGGRLPTILERLGNSFQALGEKVAPIAEQALAGLASGAKWLLQKFVDLIMSTEGFRLMVDQIMSTLRQLLEGVIGPLWQAIQPLVDLVMRLVTNLIPHVIRLFQLLGVFIEKTLPFWNILAGVLVQVIGILIDALAPVFMALAVIFKGMEPIIKLVGEVFKALEVPLKTVGMMIASVGAAFGWLLQKVGALGLAIWYAITFQWSKIKNINWGQSFADALATAAAGFNVEAAEPSEFTGAEELGAPDIGIGRPGGAIEQKRPINVEIRIYDNEIAGEDGFRDLAEIIRDEFESMGVVNA